MSTGRKALILFVVASIIACLPAAAGAAGKSGRLDLRFGVRGYATAPVTGVGAEAFDLGEVSAARAPNGHLFVAGPSSRRPAVVAFDAHGRMDRNFGSGGRLSTFAPDGSPLVTGGIAVDAEGRLLVAGVSEANASGEPLVVRRYLPDGSPDLSFGGLGYVQVTPRIEGLPGVVEPGHSFVEGVEVDPVGRILVAAAVYGAPRCPYGSAYLARLNSDGGVDPGFGDGGQVFFPSTILSGAENLTSTPEGLPVFSGIGGSFVTCPLKTPPAGPTVDRLTATGTPDSGFDGDGRAAVGDYVYGLASGSDGTLLVLEESGRVTELKADGTRDPKFERDALADLAVHSELNGIVATPDGGALVVGEKKVGEGIDGEPLSEHVVLARLDRRGKLVRGFGDEGVVSLPAGGKTQTVGDQVLLDGKGHAIVAGKLTSPKQPTAMLLLQYDLRP